MNKYAEVTKMSYGYMFIDLKKNTPEEERLNTAILDGVPGREGVRCNAEVRRLIEESRDTMVGRDFNFDDVYITDYT